MVQLKECFMPAGTVKKKRGRPGDKIAQAFAAIGSKPTPVTELIAKYGVAEAVLRQGKRFDKTGLGKVTVKKLPVVVPASGARSKVLCAYRAA